MSRWKKALILIGIFVAWSSSMIFADGKGYSSEYFWISCSLTAIAFAIAPFWHLRTSPWYWPAIGLVGALNLGALYLLRSCVSNPDLPSKGTVQGLFILAIVVDWSIMVAACWLVSRHLPWRSLDEL